MVDKRLTEISYTLHLLVTLYSLTTLAHTWTTSIGPPLIMALLITSNYEHS